MSCIHTFFRFIQTDYPELLSDCQKIIGIPFRRKHTPCIQYLNSDDMKLLLSQPDASNKSGRRDQVLLSLMYDTGARVQEIADLTVSSIRLEAPAQITLIGKGRKARVVPLLKNTVSMLKEYLKENRLDSACKMQYPLFTNRCGNPLTRAGISYILKKYADMARAEQSLFPESITPHILRHSKAMHLLEAGVNIIYIRDILGHVNVSTTEVYARANMEMKRSALEKVSHISDNEVPSWTTNASLLDWLNSFGKNLN